MSEAETLVERLLAAPLRLVDTAPLQPLALGLADRFGLPAIYDAQYLALAHMESDMLWTADRKLFDATAKELPFVRWFESFEGGL